MSENVNKLTDTVKKLDIKFYTNMEKQMNTNINKLENKVKRLEV